MKKFFTLLLALTATLTAWSNVTQIDGIYYILAGDSATVTFTGSEPYSDNSYSGSITIPSSVTYLGTIYRVTSIGGWAFSNCTGLTSVTIPNSVTSISSGAFYGCTGLTSITIPNSVTSIGYEVFRGCTALISVTIPNSVTSIGSSAFSGCSGLTSITIPNSVTSIGYEVFRGCSALTSVTIPNSVTSICQSAFSGCSGLTSITIPNSVTSIGYEAFYGCTGLTSITLPNSVTSTGDYAFRNCTGLTSVTIPNSVTSIGDGAFVDCTGLTSVTIPNSVTSIGDNAFYGCTALTSITVDSNNPTYDSRNNCNAIIETATNTLIVGCKSTVIPNSVTSIGGAFYGCTSLTSVTIPKSVTSIGDYAFSYCDGLTSITIGNSVTRIGDYAFRNCTGLTSITIGNSVTRIGDYAFRNCTGLTSIICYATTPPTCVSDCLLNVDKSIPLYVPAASISLYQAAYGWKDFTNIKAIGATDTTLSVNQPQVTPGSTDVTITWPKDSQADTYTITITKNGETVCTLTFNAQGQLTNIAFAPARGASQGNQAAQTVNGYQFTVTGLEAGTNYNYTVTTSANGTTLSTQSGSFTTKTTALTDIQAPNTAADGKYFLNGHLYIQKAGHLYTPAGHQLK